MTKIILAKGTIVSMSDREAIRAVEDALKDSGMERGDARREARFIESELAHKGRAWAESLGLFLVAV